MEDTPITSLELGTQTDRRPLLILLYPLLYYLHIYGILVYTFHSNYESRAVIYNVSDVLYHTAVLYVAHQFV